MKQEIKKPLPIEFEEGTVEEGRPQRESLGERVDWKEGTPEGGREARRELVEKRERSCDGVEKRERRCPLDS